MVPTIKPATINRFPKKPVCFGSVLAVCLSVLTLPACSDSDTDAISRVESGLLPLVSTEDQLGARFSIEQRMHHYDVPGVSIAVFREGKIEWAKGYGFARPNENLPITKSTLFQAASISKSATAVGALRLVQDGKLRLDEDINDSLDSWHIPPSRFTKEQDVTLRDLLGHTAGITVHGFPGYSRDADIPTLEEILNGVEPANTERIEVNDSVGDNWRYSGGGYTIIQQLMIDVTQQAFQQFMSENVLIPLGMTNSTFELPLDDEMADRSAWGYRPGLGPVVGGYHHYPELAAAGLWSTPTDLAAFAIGVQRAASGHPASVINQELANELLTANMGNYGFGVMISGSGKSLQFWHTGINEGFNSMYLAYSETGTGAVVMTNSNLSSGLITEIVRSIAEEYDWLDYPTAEQRESSPFSAEQLADYPGVYEIEEGFEVSIVREDESLYMIFPSQGRTEIYSDSYNNMLFITGFPFPPFQLDVDETGSHIHFPAPGE